MSSATNTRARLEIAERYYEGCERVVELEKNGHISGRQARDMIRDLHDRKVADERALTDARPRNTEEDDEDGETLGSDDSDSDYCTEDEEDDEDDSFIDDDEDEEDYDTEEEEDEDEEDDEEEA